MTSSASGAATNATGSAPRSARTPSTPRLSTSSQPSPSGSTRPVTSTWESRPGTRRGRSRSQAQHTGRRCRIPNRSPSRSGVSRLTTKGGGTAAASAALAVEARNPRVARLGLLRRAVESHTAHPGQSEATGYRLRTEPLTDRYVAHAGGRDGNCALDSTAGFLCGYFRHRSACSRDIPSVYITLSHALANRGDQWVSDMLDSGLTHQGPHEVAVQAATGCICSRRPADRGCNRRIRRLLPGARASRPFAFPFWSYAYRSRRDSDRGSHLRYGHAHPVHHVPVRHRPAGFIPTGAASTPGCAT